MEVAQEFLNKTGRKLADIRGPIMAASKHPTCSDSQRHFATRKIKVEYGKAWGFCALGREGVRWAHIYSKARTPWGFHRPWQDWSSRPDPKPPFLTSYPIPRLPTISTSNSLSLYFLQKNSTWHSHISFFFPTWGMCTWPLHPTQFLLTP